MKLTPDEVELLQLLSKGESVKQIAHQKELTVTAIERRIERLRIKHQCRNLLQLVTMWLKSSKCNCTS